MDMFPIIRGAEYSLELIKKFKNNDITKEEFLEDLEFIQSQIQAHGIQAKQVDRFNKITWNFISRAIVKLNNCKITRNGMSVIISDKKTKPLKRYVKEWAEDIMKEDAPWNSINVFRKLISEKEHLICTEWNKRIKAHREVKNRKGQSKV